MVYALYVRHRLALLSNTPAAGEKERVRGENNKNVREKEKPRRKRIGASLLCGDRSSYEAVTRWSCR